MKQSMQCDCVIAEGPCSVLLSLASQIHLCIKRERSGELPCPTGMQLSR